MTFKYLEQDHGIILVGALIVTFFFLFVSVALAEFGISHYSSTRRSLMEASTLNAAEAGADAFMNGINNDTNYQGTTSAPSGATNSCSGYTISPVTLVSNSPQGKVTYESCVKNGTIAGEKVVESTGKVYQPSTASTPRVTRKVRLIINQSTSPNYSVMTGPGGLSLSNNVHIYAGPVYVGGKLNLSNNSSIGTAANPVATYVADIACPSPATAAFPTACTSGNSITTGAGAHIYGDTHVLNNVDDASRLTNSGLVDHIVPPIGLPVANHSTLTSGLSNAGSMASKSCSGGVMHLNGHYTSSSSTTLTVNNNCTIYLDGDVWLDGNLNIGNNVTLKPANSLATPPNLIIDGSTGFISGNNTFVTANSSNVGFALYTFWSADAGCSPDCSSVTGTNLANSQNVTTINISNNTTGSANIFFYARWSKLILSNNTTVGQLMGQTIQLDNNGTIQFSSTSGGFPNGWDVRYYEQVYR